MNDLFTLALVALAAVLVGLHLAPLLRAPFAAVAGACCVLVCGTALADTGAPLVELSVWLPVVLLAGAALLKTVMTVLDRVRALDKLPPYLKPVVTGALAAVLALLEHLASGGDLPRAAMVALAAFSGNELLHHVAKGVRKATA